MHGRVARCSLFLSSLFVSGCRTSGSESPNATTSPQASAVPAPLTTGPLLAATGTTGRDAGPPPLWTHAREAFPEETAPLQRSETGKEIKEATFSLEASFHVFDTPPIPKGPEVNTSLATDLRKRFDPTVSLELGAARMRWTFGPGFVLQKGVEVRARRDRYGHVVLWGDRTKPYYRVAPPGTLRSLLIDGRFDASPLQRIDHVEEKARGKRYAYPTRTLSVSTRLANVTIELARVPESLEGGRLLARTLTDLLNLDPREPFMELDEVPTRFEVHWTSRGGFLFDVLSLQRRTDLLQFPAVGTGYRFSPTDAPPFSRELIPVASMTNVRQEPGRQDLPRVSLKVVNHDGNVNTLWIDGLPTLHLQPEESLELFLPKGKLHVALRSFFGARDERKELSLPAVFGETPEKGL